ncbi:uncharacterized protein TNCV_2205101 [Trichonephila clavipes]|nr:uncharacterized protein TNCV_2205101 [Trichonephila clavipes]
MTEGFVLKALKRSVVIRGNSQRIADSLFSSPSLQDLKFFIMSNGKEKYPPYSINLGKGVGMELKEFRGQYYVGLSKCSDSSNEVIRNRFNIPLAQLEVLKKACDAMLSYVKDCT